MAEIRLAESEEERLEVYRFRYSVYVDEMGLNESYADHARKIIRDPLDGPQSLLLAAWDGGRVVGTTRTNLIRDGGFGRYLEYYRLLGQSVDELQDTSISTRIMIHPAFRRTPLTVRLTCVCFRWMLDQGVKTDFCDCVPVVVPFFSGLGYHVQFADFIHPEFGGEPGSVMRLDALDLDHLIQVRSPLRRVLSAWQALGQPAAAVDA